MLLQEGRNSMAILAKGYVNLKSWVKRRKPLPLRCCVASAYMARERNLLLRPGRPSGMQMPVPDSQLRGLLSCRLSLLSYTGTPTAAGVARRASVANCGCGVRRNLQWDDEAQGRSPVRDMPESCRLLKMPPSGMPDNAHLRKLKTDKK